ncbi:MAG: hypothetical protein LBG97_00435 [Coriobacteriales bacterium]|nr:hypothetical protein [Coriobacteriales bacterium]
MALIFSTAHQIKYQIKYQIKHQIKHQTKHQIANQPLANNKLLAFIIIVLAVVFRRDYYVYTST